MQSSHTLDRLDVAFDDDRLVADAGLHLPATLAAHLGLRELVDRHLDLGAKPGRANPGDKLLSLVMSALAGGDSIDDADALRAGGTGRILGFSIKAPSTLGTFLRSFSWGHVRKLDASAASRVPSAETHESVDADRFVGRPALPSVGRHFWLYRLHGRCGAGARRGLQRWHPGRIRGAGRSP